MARMISSFTAILAHRYPGSPLSWLTAILPLPRRTSYLLSYHYERIQNIRHSGNMGRGHRPDPCVQAGKGLGAPLEGEQLSHWLRRTPALGRTYQALAAGLIAEGAAVTGAGLVSTPLLHFTQMGQKFPAAVMVTASHNPKEYHGFKAFDATGGSLSYDKGLSRVEAIVAGIEAPASIPRFNSRQRTASTPIST